MKKTIILLLPLFLGIIGGLMALHFYSFKYIEKYLLRNDKSDLIPVEVTEIREIYIRESEAIVNAANNAGRAIVPVKTITKTGIVEGFGLIVSSDGLVVVLNESIPFGGDFNFFIREEKISYEIIKRDESKNLALVRVGKSNLPVAEFRNLENLRLGEVVIAVGKFFDDEQKEINSVNQGIVRRIDDYIRTNIFEEKKMQGSILFDVEGKVLGINLVSQRGEVYSILVSDIQEFINL